MTSHNVFQENEEEQEAELAAPLWLLAGKILKSVWTLQVRMPLALEFIETSPNFRPMNVHEDEGKEWWHPLSGTSCRWTGF